MRSTPSRRRGATPKRGRHTGEQVDATIIWEPSRGVLAAARATPRGKRKRKKGRRPENGHMRVRDKATGSSLETRPATAVKARTPAGGTTAESASERTAPSKPSIFAEAGDKCSAGRYRRGGAHHLS